MIITIEKRGVVTIAAGGYESDLEVNSESLLDLLEKAVSKAKPETTCDGEFAARVKIELEFLGDMKPEGGGTDV